MITLKEYLELKDDYVGVCITCGWQQDNVEPDARKVPCEECGHLTVFGVEELLQMGQVT